MVAMRERCDLLNGAKSTASGLENADFGRYPAQLLSFAQTRPSPADGSKKDLSSVRVVRRV